MRPRGGCQRTALVLCARLSSRVVEKAPGIEASGSLFVKWTERLGGLQVHAKEAEGVLQQAGILGGV